MIVTDSNGLYQIRYLNSGTYTVTAELSGFKKVVRSGYEVHIAMETGAIAETIIVVAVRRRRT